MAGAGVAQEKEKLAAWLSRRFFVRFHFSLILGASFAAGLLTTKGFLALGLDTLHWRWPLALLAAYLTFLLCTRLWLAYVGLGRYLDDRDAELPLDALNVDLPNLGSRGPALDLPAPRLPGGGQFGGGGAGGDFGAAAVDSGGGTLGDGLGKSVGKLVGKAGDVGGADEGCLVVLLIAALLAVIFGAGVFMIWQAPALLAEVAFEAALAAGLVKPLRRIDAPGWVGGALRASAIPFAVIFACTMVIAGLAEHYAPQAHTLPEAIRILLESS